MTTEQRKEAFKERVAEEVLAAAKEFGIPLSLDIPFPKFLDTEPAENRRYFLQVIVQANSSANPEIAIDYLSESPAEPTT